MSICEELFLNVWDAVLKHSIEAVQVQEKQKIMIIVGIKRELYKYCHMTNLAYFNHMFTR